MCRCLYILYLCLLAFNLNSGIVSLEKLFSESDFLKIKIGDEILLLGDDHSLNEQNNSQIDLIKKSFDYYEKNNIKVFCYLESRMPCAQELKYKYKLYRNIMTELEDYLKDFKFVQIKNVEIRNLLGLMMDLVENPNRGLPEEFKNVTVLNALEEVEPLVRKLKTRLECLNKCNIPEHIKEDLSDLYTQRISSIEYDIRIIKKCLTKNKIKFSDSILKICNIKNSQKEKFKEKLWFLGSQLFDFFLFDQILFTNSKYKVFVGGSAHAINIRIMLRRILFNFKHKNENNIDNLIDSSFLKNNLLI